MSPDQLFQDFALDQEPSLRRFTTVLTGDPRAADEIVDRTLSWAALIWDRVQRDGQPAVYVRGLIVDEYRSRSRSSRRGRPANPCAELLEVLDPGDPAQAEREAVDRDVARLPHTRRAILVLSFYENLPEYEIAALLRRSRGRVRRAIVRATPSAAGLRAAFERLERLTPQPSPAR